MPRSDVKDSLPVIAKLDCSCYCQEWYNQVIRFKGQLLLHIVLSRRGEI